MGSGPDRLGLEIPHSEDTVECNPVFYTCGGLKAALHRHFALKTAILGSFCAFLSIVTLELTRGLLMAFGAITETGINAHR